MQVIRNCKVRPVAPAASYLSAEWPAVASPATNGFAVGAATRFKVLVSR
jgi:hypothetical protein